MLPQAQYPEKFQVMSEPQRALISTISAGQEAIDSASSLLNEKAKLPPLGSDPASVKWKETQWNTNQQAVHSQVLPYYHISHRSFSVSHKHFEKIFCY